MIVIATMDDLSTLHLRQQEYGEAEEILIKTLDFRRLAWGEEHENALSTMRTIGTALIKVDRGLSATWAIRQMPNRALGSAHTYIEVSPERSLLTADVVFSSLVGAMGASRLAI